MLLLAADRTSEPLQPINFNTTYITVNHLELFQKQFLGRLNLFLLSSSIFFQGFALSPAPGCLTPLCVLYLCPLLSTATVLLIFFNGSVPVYSRIGNTAPLFPPSCLYKFNLILIYHTIIIPHNIPENLREIYAVLHESKNLLSVFSIGISMASPNIEKKF